MFCNGIRKTSLCNREFLARGKAVEADRMTLGANSSLRLM